MIREATLEDRSEFLRLWAEHMDEQEKEGSFLKANTHNLYHYLGFFESYTLGQTAGVCVVFDTGSGLAGGILAGEFPGIDDWQISLGKLATVWGIYVQPSHRGQGIGVRLMQKCLELGLERGFETVETYVRSNNPHGQRMARAFGVKAYMEQHVIPLRDPGVLNNEEALRALSREMNHG